MIGVMPFLAVLSALRSFSIFKFSQVQLRDTLFLQSKLGSFSQMDVIWGLTGRKHFASFLCLKYDSLSGKNQSGLFLDARLLH